MTQSLCWAAVVGVGLHRVKRWLVVHAQDTLARFGSMLEHFSANENVSQQFVSNRIVFHRYSPRETSASVFWILLFRLPWSSMVTALDAGTWTVAIHSHGSFHSKIQIVLDCFAEYSYYQ